MPWLSYAENMEVSTDDFNHRSNTAVDLAMCRPYKNFGTRTSEEWATFVMNNRNRRFHDFASPNCNLDNKYDIVIGPIANDDMNT